MSKTINIVGGIYYDPDHGDYSPEYTFFAGSLQGFSAYVPVMEHTLTFTLPSDWQPQVAEIAALEKMREEARKKFTETDVSANMNSIFAGILANIERQPLTLHRAAVKAAPRRFTGDAPSAFGDLAQIAQRGFDRFREVMDDELADQRADERRERDERGE